MLRLLLIFLCVSLAMPACNRREADTAADDALREKELNLFLSAIRAVQERYVDVDQVQLDALISNSLKGMVEAIDPHAVILPANASTSNIVAPLDAPPIEIFSDEGGSISVVRIFRFDATMRKALRALEPAMRSRSPSGILIDSRGALGSDYDAVVAVAEWFVGKGLLVGSMIEHQGERVTRMTTKRQPVWANGDIVVLVDHLMSGPSELLALVLRHYRQALLVGEQTRGIAVIRTPITIHQDWTILLTTGRVIDPFERDITGNPITPDIEAQPRADLKENVDWLYRRGMAALKDLAF